MVKEFKLGSLFKEVKFLAERAWRQFWLKDFLENTAYNRISVTSLPDSLVCNYGWYMCYNFAREFYEIF